MGAVSPRGSPPAPSLTGALPADLKIQGETHDSIEDARTALQLYRKYLELSPQGAEPEDFRKVLKGLYEKGRKMDWKVPEPDSQSSPKRKAPAPGPPAPPGPPPPLTPLSLRQMGPCTPPCWPCERPHRPGEEQPRPPRGRRTRMELEPAAGTGLSPPLPDPPRGPAPRDSPLPAGAGNHCRPPHPRPPARAPS